MGSFPYPDNVTGKCRVAWVLSMRSHRMRDAIVSRLRMAIRDAGLPDIIITEEDEQPDSRYKSPWPATLEIVAMGPSITNTLVGELRIQAALTLLEALMARIGSI